MKKIVILMVFLMLISGCSSMKALFKSPAVDNPVIYGSEELSWCNEYNDAMTHKKIVGGMNCEMVQNVMGAPMVKKQQSPDIVVWEYPNKRLVFLQDLLISWKEK